ncbi:MAG: DUF401 family protein [Fibrobacter sp.]|nr:DUF401 family protein [Fibrobacter sp.]
MVRHIWEYWWPLYPGVILAISYTGIPAGYFFLLQFPLTIISALAGYIFLLKKIPHSVNEKPDTFDIKALLQTVGPIFLLVILSLVGSILLPQAGFSKTIVNLVSLPAALMVCIGLTFKTDYAAVKRSAKSLFSRQTWALMLIIVGVQSFSAALLIPAGDSSGNLVSMMRGELFSMGVPILLVIMVIPFVSGAVTGVAAGFVGASFPLVFALLGENCPFGTLAAVTVLAYASGYFGMIISPLHVCLVVSNEYFKSRLSQAYRFILLPALTLFLGALFLAGSYYLLIR